MSMDEVVITKDMLQRQLLDVYLLRRHIVQACVSFRVVVDSESFEVVEPRVVR